MHPIITLEDLLKKADLTPRDCVTASVALTAVILAFIYFALTWATNRMKAAEDTSPDHRGSPALICWTSAIGTLSFTIVGTGLFAPLYFATNTNIYIWHVIPLVSTVYVWFYFWLCLIRMFILHRRNNGVLCPFTKEMLTTIHDYRRGFWPVVGSIVLVGWSTFFETLIGDFPAGIMGICFFLISVTGLGCYISLVGDLFPRAIAQTDSG